jgi:hypothetical protein
MASLSSSLLSRVLLGFLLLAITITIRAENVVQDTTTGDHDITFLQTTLKNKLEQSLNAYVEGNDNADEEENADALIAIQAAETNGNQVMLQLNQQFKEAAANNEQVDAQSSSFVQVGQKMSFSCWLLAEDTCESEDCTWKDSKCTLSPAAYSKLCAFYCETSICVQPPGNVEPGSVVCPVKPFATEGLCQAIKLESNCALQSGLCKWTAKEGCVNTATCCSKAEASCKRKRNRQLLATAVKACTGFASEKSMCSFWKSQCLPKEAI